MPIMTNLQSPNEGPFTLDATYTLNSRTVTGR